MGIGEAFESPGFWLLGIGGVSAEIIGYIWSKNMEMVIMPLWQLILMMAVTLMAAAYFGTQD